MRIEHLQYITQGTSQSAILSEVNEALEAGVKWIQLRVKNANKPIITIARDLKILCKNKAIFIINDDVDMAREIDADGVHLGLSDMPIVRARKVLGQGKIIGATANTLNDVLCQQDAGANYIGLGPYNYTMTKSKLSPILGAQGIAQIIKESQPRIPVVVVGGITMRDIELISSIGAWGVAVSGLIFNSKNKKHLVNDITNILKTYG